MLRTDSKIKVDGTALFSMDKHLSGMLYAMVERPKYFGAKYKNSNMDQIKNQNGIIDVFRIPSGVAIVGEKYWSVVKARKLLKVNWEKSQIQYTLTAKFIEAIWINFQTENLQKYVKMDLHQKFLKMQKI